VTVFTDLSAFVSQPRVTSLRLSPDGTWLAATVQTVAGEPAKYVTSIWRLETAPEGAPARLTRSAEGEGGPEFLADGSLLFASKRPAAPPRRRDDGAAQDKAAQDKLALWLLPAAGGEARQIAAPPGGVSGISAARDLPAVVYSAAVLPAATGPADDAGRRKARADAGVNAILHESGTVRYWDQDLGPDSLRLLTAPIPASEDGEPCQPRDLTPDAGRALDEQGFELTPDGSAVVTGWMVAEPAGEWRIEVVVIEVGTGSRRTLLTSAEADFAHPRVSPDGGLVVATRTERDTYDRPGDGTLVVAALSGTALSGTALSGTARSETARSETALSGADGGQPRDLLSGFDRLPVEVAWAPDSRSVYFTADDQGRKPVFRVDLAGGGVTSITADDGAYDNLSPSPDGRYLYALRSAVDAPPAPVRIDLAGDDADEAALVWLNSPGAALEVPGRLEEVQATAADGTTIRGWLVLPEAARADAPVPLLLWVHGGPQSSWNTWSWRWNPWLMAARGYAVLLPDPALSTGYGQHMMERGHGTWGANPYTDVMAITDAVVERPDIDASRTAMMGGSFGGYLANWIAGHTGRFSAIVSHAGLWALDQFNGTTDEPAYWRRVFGDPAVRPERYHDNSPHLHVANIVTPMLVIHGDKDYRVPVGEALRLWADLTSYSKVARFLYFPDENHWILKPGDATVWYETVFAFLAEHVLGEQWRRPDLL
jgi:dipeptidyl aminopeptidase/acylaminoacyl peptidase